MRRHIGGLTMDRALPRIGIARVIVVGLIALIVGPSLAAPEPTYDSLLGQVLVPSSDPLFGSDEHEYAMTHALVLASATLVGDDETAESMIRELRDSQMPNGWGMPWEWDAFADGSVNPTTTAYGITTALALHALLDAAVTNHTDQEVAAYWAERLDWYSDQPTDAVWTPNVAAMLAAAVARFGHFEEAQAVFDRLAVARFAWPYSARQDTANDLSHYVYILWGAEVAREEGVEVAWTTDEAIASLDRYTGIYPDGVPLTKGMVQASFGPWAVSGNGMTLAFVSRFGGDVSHWATRTRLALNAFPSTPRFTAHAVYGIAFTTSHR